MIVSCPHCRKKLKIEDSLAGKRAVCPACKQAFAIARTSPPTRHEPGQVVPPPAAGRAGPQKPPGDNAPKQAGVKPPPLPPGAGPGVPSGRTLTPGVSGDGAGSSLRFAMNGLVAALSIHKVAYFILSLMVFVPLFGVPAAVVVSVFDPLKSRVSGGACLVILVVLGTGLGGVLAGGMAHLAIRDEGGRRGTVWSAFGFCARQFVSLFMGAVMFAAVVLVALVAVNGLIMLVSGTSRPGSILAALLLLPQFLVNVALALAAVVAILVPVAIATENVGAVQAVGRVLDCVRRDTSRLFVHLAASTLIGDVIIIVLGKIFLVSLGLTLAANSPMLVGVLMSDFGSVGHVEEADVVLRLLAVGLIACVLLGYLSAYWVGSFAGYYRDALRRGFDARPRTRR